MSGSVRILIPCRTFEVNVRRGFEDGLSPMECAVLECLHAGAETTDAVAVVLGLESRMVVDSCVAFLQADLIWVNPENGKLRVADVVADALGDPSANPPKAWSKPFAANSRQHVEPTRVFQELVSGSVFSPPPRSISLSRAELSAPVRQDLGPLDAIPRRDLLVAVSTSRAAKKQRAAADSGVAPNWILDVELVIPSGSAGSAAAAQGSSGSIIVEAVCRWRELDDDVVPELHIIAPAALPVRVRLAISQALAGRYASGEAQGDGQFFHRLRNYTENAGVAAGDPAADALQKSVKHVLAELRSRSSAPDSLDCHTSLDEADFALHESMAVHERHVVPHKLIDGAAGFHDLLHEALETATDQVVLANPWVSRLARPEVVKSLVAAVARGIQVHVLWGIASGDPLPSDVLLALSEIRAATVSATGALHLDERPSRTHAKVITCDARWAVVGSCNFLNSRPDRSAGELGIWFGERGSVGRAHEAVGDVLRWAASIAPSARQRSALDAMISMIAASTRETGAGYDPIPAPTAESISRGLSVFWRREWQRRIEARVQCVSGLTPATHLIFGGQHRLQVVRALEHAERRVIVASPHLGRGILGERMRALVQSATSRGCHVQILHQIWANYDEASSLLVKRRMPDVHELASTGAELLHWDSHAKLIVCDDAVTVGSFNHLSLEGFRGDEPRARSELSAWTEDPALAEQVVALVESRASRWDRRGP